MSFMAKGKVAPVDGNLDRSYGVCAKCKVRRPKMKMHTILVNDKITTYICKVCIPGEMKT